MGPAGRWAGREPLVRSRRVGHRALTRERDDGIDLWVDRVDLGQVGGQHLAGRHVLSPDSRRQLYRTEEDQLAVAALRLRQRFTGSTGKADASFVERRLQRMP